MCELQKILDNIEAEAEAAVEAEEVSHLTFLTLCLIANHRVPRLCKALKVAIDEVVRSNPEIVDCRAKAESRVLAILKGKKDE